MHPASDVESVDIDSACRNCLCPSQSEFLYNSAGAFGGAIAQDLGTSNLTLEGPGVNTFEGNHAGSRGGAISLSQGQLLVMGALCAQSNQANAGGGFLDFSGGDGISASVDFTNPDAANIANNLPVDIHYEPLATLVAGNVSWPGPNVTVQAVVAGPVSSCVPSGNFVTCSGCGTKPKRDNETCSCKQVSGEAFFTRLLVLHCSLKCSLRHGATRARRCKACVVH